MTKTRRRRGSFKRKVGDAIQVLLKYSPWVVAPIVAAGMIQYFPDDWEKLPVSKYLIAGLAGLATAVVLVALRAHVRVRNGRRLEAQPPPVDEVSTAIHGAYDEAKDGSGAGWSHYLGEYHEPQIVTPLSTAYGLQTLMLLGFQTPPLDIAECQRMIRARVHADGGWSVQSQRGIGRAEVTAVIAATLARLGGHDEVLKRAASLIRSAVIDGSDPLTASNTYVVATVLEHAPYLDLGSDVTIALQRRLLEGAIKDAAGYYWTEKLDNKGARPSTAQTAQSVIALQAISKLSPSVSANDRAKEVLDGAIEWLDSEPDLALSSSELIRYPSDGQQDLSAPRHFTAALVLVALLQAGRVQSRAALRAHELVWDSYGSGGVWTWDNGESPIWMTFMGLRALLAWSRRPQEVN